MTTVQPPLSNDEKLVLMEKSLSQLKTFAFTHDIFETMEDKIISKFLRDLDDAELVLLDLLCRPSLQSLPSGRSREEILTAHLARFVSPVLPTGAQIAHQIPVSTHPSTRIVPQFLLLNVLLNVLRQRIIFAATRHIISRLATLLSNVLINA